MAKWSEAQKRYAHSPKGIQARKKYQASDKAKEARKRYMEKRKAKLAEIKTEQVNNPVENGEKEVKIKMSPKSKKS